MSTQAVLQGFLKGFGLCSGLVLLTKRKLPKGPDLQRALALGAFTAIFRYMRLEDQYDRQKAAVVGVACAALIDPTLTGSTVVLWLLCRTLKHALPPVPYGPMAVMCACSAQLITTWVLNPQFLDPSYLRFFDRQGSVSVKNTLAVMRNPTQRSHIDSLLTLFLSQQRVPQGWFRNSAPSRAVHTLIFFAYFFKRACVRAATIYGPVFVLYQLYAHIRKPKSALYAAGRIAENVSRSTAFLASYTVLGWGMQIAKDEWSDEPVRTTAFSSVFYRYTWFYSVLWIAGLSTLFEAPSRRADLAAYCATYALDSLCRATHCYTSSNTRHIIGGVALCTLMCTLMRFYDPEASQSDKSAKTASTSSSASQRDTMLNILF